MLDEEERQLLAEHRAKLAAIDVSGGLMQAAQLEAEEIARYRKRTKELADARIRRTIDRQNSARRAESGEATAE